MKVDKSLQEVWDWKEEIYQETKHMNMHERIEHIHKGAEKIRKKYNLHLRQAPSRESREGTLIRANASKTVENF